jgi:DNA-binding beta-propeller fold protein YncE
MIKNIAWRNSALSAFTIASLSLFGAVTDGRAGGTFLPTGQTITPTAIPGSHLSYLKPGFADAPQFISSGGISTLITPDQKTLLVLTSGYNQYSNLQALIPDASQQYVFVYDISAHKPVQKQVIIVPNTYAGMALSPDGQTLYVGGGVDDDLHSYTIQNGAWAESGTPIKLGHSAGLGLGVSPATAGVAVTADGTQVLVTNLYNASLSIISVANRSVTQELDLRPGKVDPGLSGVPGGEYPTWVSVKGNDVAYVSSLRDRQIVMVQLGANPQVIGYTSTSGSPIKTILNQEQTRLYVTEDFQDLVQVFDISNPLAMNLVRSISTKGPNDAPFTSLHRYLGMIPTSLALTPDEQTLLVTNSGTNSVGVISLNGKPATVAQLPTGFYPDAVSVSGDGKWAYVVNAENVTGPNPEEYNIAGNQYVFQLQKSSLLSFPIPAQAAWQGLTEQVEKNNQISVSSLTQDQALMQQLHQRIKHIIYIVAENRTYDQMLGDLDRGNGDPILTEYGATITPNFHQIATQFVDLDNFYDPGDVSGNGWQWSVAGRQADFNVKSILENYAGRGMTYDSEGQNSNINVGLPTAALRQQYDNPQTPSDPDLLPGTADVAAPDGGSNTEQGEGYLWDAALRAGLTVRDYGFYSDPSSIGGGPTYYRYPFAEGKVVVEPTKQALMGNNFDPYCYDFDNNYPDFYREYEWEREFNQFVTNGNLPALEFVRLMHDHMGSFSTAIDGVNTPELQQADHDYAVALLIQAVANSPYKDSTLIMVVEDDAQDGADHVDSHRSTCYIAGPYLKQGAVVSHAYTTINVLRTIEDVLGLDHVDLYTAAQPPMSAVFDLKNQGWNFTARPSALLADTQLPINTNAFAGLRPMKPTHDAAYWAEKTNGFNFKVADDLKDPAQFNRIIWTGLKGDEPYPTVRSGLDLRNNRAALLKKAGIEQSAAKPHSAVAANP